MSKILLSIATIGLVAAGPAFADPREPKAEARPTADATAAPAAKPTRYCIMTEAPTGSRIDRQVCQTREAWLRDGVDPLTLKRR